METQTLDIPVVWPDYYEDCLFCIERIREALEGLDGMQSVVINPDRRTVQLTYDKELLTFEDISERARAVGVEVAEHYKHERMTISGLDCPDCALKVETAIRKTPGVVWASLNYATSILIVEYDPKLLKLDVIVRKVRDFGYDVEEKIRTPAEEKRIRTRRSMRVTLTVLSGILLVAGGLLLALGSEDVASALFIAAAVTGGVFAVRAGILSLKGLSLDTNFLMTVAAIGAIVLGDYWEAGAVMFLFSLGSTLEAYTVEKTRRSIRSLMEAFPTSATVRRNGELRQVPLEDVEIGETVIVKPGEKIPVDGTVTEGSSAVNEAPITGESVPKDKNKGDVVYAGSINGRGSLQVRTTSTAEDNTIARIVHMVEEAQAQKAPSQRFSETFGRYYTPAVISLAVMIGAIGPLITAATYQESIKTALILLVVSCPCALVISTPVAIVAAIGNAARSGILIKGGAYLETLGEVTVTAFDKTGTLTMGKLSLREIVPVAPVTEEELLATAAAVESRSEHPLADAVVRKAQEMGVQERHVSFFEAFPGKGARAVVNGEVVYIGSGRFLEETGISGFDQPVFSDLMTKGYSVIYVAREGKLIGALGAADEPKPSSAEAISQLRDVGIRRTVMLTGDTAQTGRAVARMLGIDDEYSELLPEDKLAKIRELSSGPEKVAMVGDGINDAPALAAADVGIAMGGAGTHAAIEAADVALMADDIVMLPYAVSLSRRARRIIKQNVAFALIVVALLIIGALTQRVNLATGVLGHEGSALFVIANSMRLLRR